jgi:hypothetical protein
VRRPRPLATGCNLRTARHEAAHAVVAELFGIRVTRLELYAKPYRGYIGACWLDRRFDRGRLTRALIAAAGPVAEHQWHKVPRRWFQTSDANDLQNAFSVKRDLDLVIETTRRIVREHAETIDRVARELFKRGNLTGTEVRRILARK